MNIIQCSLCKKPFQSYGRKECTNCLEEMDTHFVTVRDYLDENPGAGVDKVAEATEVPKKFILFLIKEGRLIMGGGKSGGGGLICEVCKKPIDEGKICPKCKHALASVMDKSTQKKPAEPVAKEENFKGTAKIGK